MAAQKNKGRLSIGSVALVLLGLVILTLALTGYSSTLVQMVMMRMGLVDEFGDPTSGFVDYKLPVDDEWNKVNAPTIQVEITPSPTPAAVTVQPTIGLQNSTPTPTPYRPVDKPMEMIISSVGIDAKVIDSKPDTIRIGSTEYIQWKAPDENAVGWQNTSARLGEIGNSVFFGHHNVHGMVFKELHNVKQGDLIEIKGRYSIFTYQVVNVMIFKERGVDMQTRLENARWILPSDDERLTLITCHPFETNTHRVVVVAIPYKDPIPIKP
ncbi:MAG TPA: sortase [Bellilinea sp.]|nr:sortase [Bellilinea sp.]